MVLAVLFILNDPIDRLLPVPAPALRAGPDTTWDAAVTVRDGQADWTAAIEAGRSAVPGSPQDAWPELARALAAAGLPRAEPKRTLADLRAGLNIEPSPAELAEQARAAQPVLDLLAAAPPQTVWALPAEPGAVEPEALRALRQLIAAAMAAPAAPSAAAHLRAAARLLPLIRAAAHGEDLAAAALAHRADAGFWQGLLAALAAAPADAAVRAEAVALRGRHDFPAMPMALRRTRLAALALTARSVEQVLQRVDSRVRSNHPPDVNHALVLLNRWCDALDARLPADLADGRTLAALAPRLGERPDFDLGAVLDRRPLAERMLFDSAIDDRRRQMASVFASAMELATWMQVATAARQARTALLHRAAVHALLAAPPGASAAASAAALTAALPPLPELDGAVEFTAAGRELRITIRQGAVGVRAATLTLEQP